MTDKIGAFDFLALVFNDNEARGKTLSGRW